MVVGTPRFSKIKEYPRPHNFSHSWNHGMETGVNNFYTIYPIMHYDEGLGSPSTYESHPENAAFVEAGESNCFVDSKVRNVIVEIQVALTKGLLETDKVHAVQCCYMPIFMAFKEDYIAIDELSSLETQDVLHMQTESTDRQGFPLFNAVDLVTKFGTSSTLWTNQPGLT